jgi:hypothetical protein
MEINKYLKLSILLIPIILCSCSILGVQHYYKPVNKEWVSMNYYKHVMVHSESIIYRNEDSSSIVKATGMDSLNIIKNIAVSIDFSMDPWAFGILYIPIIPNLFHWLMPPINDINDTNNTFSMNFNINLINQDPRLKFEDVRFYMNEDSIDTKPINYDEERKDYSFRIKTSEVKKILIKFIKVTYKGVRIDIPDLILEQKRRIFDAMILEIST